MPDTQHDPALYAHSRTVGFSFGCCIMTSQPEVKMLEFEELNLAQRVALKQMSQRDFLTFTRLWFNLMQGDKLRVNWHHHMFADLVDDIIWRRIPNRNWVINVPPGSTKTEFFSIHAPAYVNTLVLSGKLNRFRNLNLSYSDTLTKRNSLRTKAIIPGRSAKEVKARLVH